MLYYLGQSAYVISHEHKANQLSIIYVVPMVVSLVLARQTRWDLYLPCRVKTNLSKNTIIYAWTGRLSRSVGRNMFIAFGRNIRSMILQNDQHVP